MTRYIIKRILILIPVLICITIILFSINKLMPGDPVKAMLPTNLKAEQYQAAYDAMYEKLGLDKSLPEQYVRWMLNMFQGDFGWSTMNNRAVKDVVAEPIRNTVILNVGVIILQLLISIPIGIHCAVKRRGIFDNFWQVFSLITWVHAVLLPVDVPAVHLRHQPRLAALWRHAQRFPALRDGVRACLA